MPCLNPIFFSHGRFPNTGSPDWLSYYANAVTDMSEGAATTSALSKCPFTTDGRVALS